MRVVGWGVWNASFKFCVRSSCCTPIALRPTYVYCYFLLPMPPYTVMYSLHPLHSYTVTYKRTYIYVNCCHWILPFPDLLLVPCRDVPELRPVRRCLLFEPPFLRRCWRRESPLVICRLALQCRPPRVHRVPSRIP